MSDPKPLAPDDEPAPKKKDEDPVLTPIVSAEDLERIRMETRLKKKTKIARRGDAKADIAAYLRKIFPETRTGKELEEELDMLHETVSASLIKLRSAGKVKELDEKRKNATGRYSHAYISAEVSHGRKCARCSRDLAEWPVKSLDAGEQAALDIAPDGRDFKKLVEAKVDGVSTRFYRHYCAKCLRRPKILKLVLAGKKVKRVTLAPPEASPAKSAEPERTSSFKNAKKEQAEE